jgi:O-antigen/teichoic acid export membrane protein
MSFKDLAKDGAIIGFTQVMISLANILLLPIITKTLGSGDYGIWVQTTITIALISSVVMLGQSNSVLRFLDMKKNKQERGREYFSALIMVGLVSLLATAIMIALSGVLAASIFADSSLALLVIVAALFVPFPSLIAINNAYIRAAGQIKTYAVLNILNSFLMIGAIILLIEHQAGVLGALIGSLLMSAGTFVAGFIIVVKQVGLVAPSKELWRRNIRFGLPLTPNTIVSWITSSSDRYLVGFILGISMVGIYSAAYNIGNVTFLLVAPLQMILYPTLARLYDEGRLQEVKDYTQRSLRYYLMITVPAVAGLAMLAKPILVALTTPEFAVGAMVIPLIALSGMLMGLFKFVENVIHLVRKTHLNLITFGIPAAADVVLVVLLTPLLGIVGTALASVLSFALMLGIGIVVSRPYMRFSVDWAFLGKAIGAAIVMMIAIYLLDAQSMISVLVALAVGGSIYLLAMILMKGFTSEEIGMVRCIIMRSVKKARPSETVPAKEKELKG